MGGKVYKRYRVYGKALAKSNRKLDADGVSEQAQKAAMLLTPCD